MTFRYRQVQERRPSQFCRVLRGKDAGQVPDELLQRGAVRGNMRCNLLRGLQLQQLPRTKGNATAQHRLLNVRWKRPMPEILQSLYSLKQA